MTGIPFMISNYLDFNMTGVFQEFFHIHHVITKGATGFSFS